MAFFNRNVIHDANEFFKGDQVPHDLEKHMLAIGYADKISEAEHKAKPVEAKVEVTEKVSKKK